jgi:hypothetical protein
VEFWVNRHRMQAKLIALDRAIAQVRHLTGPVIFTSTFSISPRSRSNSTDHRHRPPPRRSNVPLVGHRQTPDHNPRCPRF